MTDPVAANLDAYQRGITAYLGDRTPTPSKAYARYLDAVVAMLPAGSAMLELGSGPGYDALFFEQNGIRVQRTDGTPAFVDLMREQGFDAELVDITSDALGGPYDAVFANAVFLHLSRPQVTALAGRLRGALMPGGLLAFTVKEGDGEAWSTAKIGLPRFFVYWRATELRTLFEASGFDIESLEHVQGRVEPWLYLICRRPGHDGAGHRPAERAP